MGIKMTNKVKTPPEDRIYMSMMDFYLEPHLFASKIKMNRRFFLFHHILNQEDG